MAFKGKDVDISKETKCSAEPYLIYRAERTEPSALSVGTGSGKSSLVNMIPRFDATKGNGRGSEKAFVATVLHRFVGRSEWSCKKAQLFRGTIADNVRFGNVICFKGSDRTCTSIVAQASEFVQTKKADWIMASNKMVAVYPVGKSNG